MTGPLRIGLNLTFLASQSGGSGSYARELIPALIAVDPDVRLSAFVSRDVPQPLLDAPWSDEVDWIRLPTRPEKPGVVQPLLSIGSQWGAIPVIAAARRLDVIHGLANVIPPIAPSAATVVTILDLIWVRHPTTMTARATVGMRVVAPICARAADRVIAISNAARDDIVETLGLDPSKIDVTHLGVNPDVTVEASPEAQLRHSFGLGDSRVVLCVAQVRPHKNIAGLVEALACVRDDRVRLVIVGPLTGHEDELRESALRLGVGDRVHLTGWISQADLEGMYRLATCFVLPSFEEGFGLPILEAMRRGTSVACSAVSSLPEVAGNAALLFNPHDPASIASTIEKLLGGKELRERLVAAGYERCRLFTWHATARQTLGTYQRAMTDTQRALRSSLRTSR